MVTYKLTISVCRGKDKKNDKNDNDDDALFNYQC